MKNYLEVITVGNGDNKYVGNFTKKENHLIEKYCAGRIINLFSGNSKIGNIRIDFSHENASVNIDVFKWLDSIDTNYKFYPPETTVIIDAPYNQKFADKYQKIGNTPKQFIIFANTRDTTRLFQLIRNKIDPETIIIKSWNYYIPTGYKFYKGFLCYAGGYRKSTILLIVKKVN